MQIEHSLGNLDNLRMIAFGTHLFTPSILYILVVGRCFVYDIGDNEVSADVSLDSCMHSRTFILRFILEARIDKEHPYTCLRIPWNVNTVMKHSAL